MAGPSAWIGREVYGLGGDVGITRDGSHARYLVLPEAALRERPRNISMDEAGAVGVPFVTAYEGFRRSACRRPGRPCWCWAATARWAIGAVQLAAQAGAKVTLRSAAPAPSKASLCAPVDVVDARSEDVAARVLELTGGRGADVVYNSTVGSAYFEAANKAMAKGATQIFIATHDRAVPSTSSPSTAACTPTWASIRWPWTASSRPRSSSDARRLRARHARVLPLPVARHFTLDEALDAYRLVLSGSTDRVVLRP